MTTTLDTLCKNYGIIAARCQYFGGPHPYIVKGRARAGHVLLGTDSEASRHQDLIVSALKIGNFIGEFDAFEYRVILSSGNSILVMSHPHLEKCYIGVLYQTGSAISKSIRRMVRRQFKNFRRHDIEMAPGEIQLGDNVLRVPTQFGSGDPS